MSEPVRSRKAFTFDKLVTMREKIDRQEGRVDDDTLELLEEQYAVKRAEVAEHEGESEEAVEARVQETLYGDQMVAADDAVIGRAFKASLAAIAVLAVLALAVFWWLNRPEPEAEEQVIEAAAPEAVEETVAEVPSVTFAEVSEESGIDFVHETGAYGDKLLALYEDDTRASADVKAVAEEHLGRIEAKIAELTAMRDTLTDLTRACAGDNRPDCPILRGLEK